MCWIKGPKIRIGPIAGGPVTLVAGQTVRVTPQDIGQGSASRFQIVYPGLLKDIDVGDPIFINDGIVELQGRASSVCCAAVVDLAVAWQSRALTAKLAILSAASCMVGPSVRAKVSICRARGWNCR